MKLDQLSSFIHNLELSRASYPFIALSGVPMVELEALAELWIDGEVERFHFPDDLVRLAQMTFFSSSRVSLFSNVEKLKKEEKGIFSEYLNTLSYPAFILCSTSSAMESYYQNLKNRAIWLDLSGEKPWQKKDRNSLLLQYRIKKEGSMLDKEAALWLLEQEEGDLNSAMAMLETLRLYTLGEKRITLKHAEKLLARQAPTVDFTWMDKLLFKKEPITFPECKDPSTLLLFLGQLRYLIQQSLKIKSFQEKGMQPQEMLQYFTKMSPQALGHQVKKSDEFSRHFYLKLEGLVFAKELELKKDFSQPAAIFTDLLMGVAELKGHYAR